MGQFIPSNLISFDNNPRLSLAISYRKVCYTLLKLGADESSRDSNRWTPLMWASKLGWVKSCQALLDMQASPDDANMDGDTALHIACKQGHVGIVNLLLENGANLKVCNTQSLTCLEAAVRAGNSEVAMAMVKHQRYYGLVLFIRKSYIYSSLQKGKTNNR